MNGTEKARIQTRNKRFYEGQNVAVLTISDCGPRLEKTQVYEIQLGLDSTMPDYVYTDRGTFNGHGMPIAPNVEKYLITANDYVEAMQK